VGNEASGTGPHRCAHTQGRNRRRRRQAPAPTHPFPSPKPQTRAQAHQRRGAPPSVAAAARDLEPGRQCSAKAKRLTLTPASHPLRRAAKCAPALRAHMSSRTWRLEQQQGRPHGEPRRRRTAAQRRSCVGHGALTPASSAWLAAQHGTSAAGKPEVGDARVAVATVRAGARAVGGGCLGWRRACRRPAALPRCLDKSNLHVGLVLGREAL
jgi:hypothetical protein